MTRYALPEIILITLLGAAISAGVAAIGGWWWLVPAVLTLALLSFYRDPPRRVPDEVNILLAPADGKIVTIAPEEDSADGKRLRIMIFLSVLNVHVNRSPCAGRVKGVDYRPGRFLNALNPEADHVNESNSLTLDPAAPLPGPMMVRQIAGVLARRIVCAVGPGAELARGQRYGMIKLGSRTELVVPADPRWEVVVHLGQRVRAGVTILARYRDE
ncbi:MAG: phosphatidylserine decarboxylase family protein [Phycisphaerae bacterium]|nr:phosphatidylserine decarboxylase family protein [Phycisphaerae bacterium]